MSLQRGTRESVVAGNQNVAARAAEEISRYISSQRRHPEGARRRPAGHRPGAWQQDRIVKNYILQFREFREITLFDEARRRRRHQPGRPAARRDPDATRR